MPDLMPNLPVYIREVPGKGWQMYAPATKVHLHSPEGYKTKKIAEFTARILGYVPYEQIRDREANLVWVAVDRNPNDKKLTFYTDDTSPAAMGEMKAMTKTTIGNVPGDTNVYELVKIGPKK